MNERISILKDVQAIDRALGDSDYEAICDLGDSMKSADRDDGFDAVTPIADSLLSAAEDEDSVAVRKWMGELANLLGVDECNWE